MFRTYSHRHLKIVIAVLIIILVVLCIFLARQYNTAGRRNAISEQRLHFKDLLVRHSLGAVDVGLIAPWMTFDYVSISFKVPVAHLTSSLGISNPPARYPNVTLNHYARIVATSSDALTRQVRNAVYDYLAPASQ